MQRETSGGIQHFVWVVIGLILLVMGELFAYGVSSSLLGTVILYWTFDARKNA